jgi:hypothetical protein
VSWELLRAYPPTVDTVLDVVVVGVGDAVSVDVLDVLDVGDGDGLGQLWP